jgi:hypothetical protein
MMTQICYLYVELTALFLGGAAIIFQLMGPAATALNRDEYCS